ncbi:MAG TPA: hypothetical protein PKX55_24015, partial [Leptospiraceae bacterium]|nr:hypothetical protein [Leptospiraceae bacterium]
MNINLKQTNIDLIKQIQTIFITLALLHCATEQKQPTKPESSFVEVTAFGSSLDDADTEAKLQIVERGIGVLVEGGSAVADGQLQYSVVSTFSQGYVTDYQRISSEKQGAGFWIKAKGKPNLKAIGDALEQRRREIGNPKMLILMSENMFGKKSKAGSTKSEYVFQADLKKDGFQFDDKETVMKILAREKGLEVGAYGNPKAEELAQKIAVELNTDILVIGDAVLKNAGEVRKGTGILSIQADVKYKLVDVNSGSILATATDTAIASDVDQELGATEALKQVTEKLAPGIKQQVAKDWQAGSTTRISFKGIKLGEFLSSNITDTIKKIRGVNGVDDRGNTGVGTTIEVKCYCGRFELVKRI